jgi:transposase
MASERVDPRQARAAALVKALGARITHLAGARWIVPSQTDPAGKYTVNVDEHTCTCRDHEDRGVVCKHQIAVEILRAAVKLPADSSATAERVRVTYAQNWPAYTRAQLEEKDRSMLLLRGLCDGIVEPTQTRGRPRLPLRDIVYEATLRIFTTMSSRRAMSDVRAAGERGLVGKVAAFNSINRYMERTDMEPLLRTLVHESAAPLVAIESAFATDSTGFATNTYARWFDHKYGGEKKSQRWIKLHAQVGTVTNVIASVAATESTIGDAPMLAPLLASSIERGFNVQELSADKAYLSNGNLAAIERVGAVPYIPFKSNSSPTGGSDAWRRLWHTFSARNDEFLAHYHKRSNVETTFSMLKRKFGSSVRAKTAPAQANEVLLKCLCHNLSVLVHSIHEFGIDPRFWQKLGEVA